MWFAARTTARCRTRTVAGAAVAALAAGLLAAAPVAASGAGAATKASGTEAGGERAVQEEATSGTERGRAAQVVSRRVSFELSNTNETGRVLCTSDGELHRVRGLLVGPRREVRSSTVDRVNVLVHDVSTGSWLWHLRGHPARDYATQLARRGETSLVLDRLGYGRSSLADGSATCLGAQAQMVRELTQHLYAGQYDAAGGHAPAATQVVLHGHAAGAAVAQLAAAIDRDVMGLVLMSWSDLAPSARAVREAVAQTASCLTGGETYGDRRRYTLFGGSAADYRGMLFASAKPAVQRTAVRRRTPAPCGDVTSLAGLLTGGGLARLRVDVPVLLLYGGKDALLGSAAPSLQAPTYGPGADVTSRVFPGAGSALPLEKQAPQVRRTVLRWLQESPGLGG